MLMSKRNDRIDVARIVREAREEKGLTQTELAERVGCHSSTVCGWEDEERKHAAKLAIERTLRLCRVLDLNPAKL
jgi:ribosome-binding protein aMBF1 (putative translation factor)